MPGAYNLQRRTALDPDPAALYPLHGYGGVFEPCSPYWLRKRNLKLNQMACRRTGAFRPPRAGEWYLSGSIVEAYYAKRDFSTPYHIAELVVIEEIITHRVVEVVKYDDPDELSEDE